MLRASITAIVAAALLGVPTVAGGQAKHAMVTKSASSLEWSPIQPTGFDPGMEIAVLEGDPAAAGQPYTLRLRFTDGYRFPAHYHPNAENLSVLSGTLLLSMGATPTEKYQEYKVGDFLHIPATEPHSGGAKGVTVIQLHGTGPFDIMLAKPAASGTGQ